jgi:hypothetical protein
MAGDVRFAEWMVNYALYRHLEATEEAKKWFLSLPTTLPDGEPRMIKELCGFDWETARTDLKYETGLLRDEDRGEIGIEDFRKKYWAIRPDFRFCANGRKQQLIVEGKGRGRGPEADDYFRAQAERYFRYLTEFPAQAAVVYLVPPDHLEGWTGMLRLAAGSSAVGFGVVVWSDGFLKEIGTELALGIAESLTGSFKLLEKAIRLTRGDPRKGPAT